MRGVTVNPAGETPDVGIPRRLAAAMTVAEQQEWLRRYLIGTGSAGAQR
jgi:hypothetical protein